MPVEHDEIPFDDRLGAALRQAGDTFEADGAALVAAGRVRGRNLRLRRRAAVAGGAAGIALVGVGGALLVPWDGGDKGGQESVASGRTTPSPDSTVAEQTRAAVSGPELLRTLEGLLPEGKFSERSARATDHALGPTAHLVFDDGGGKAAVEIGLDRIDPRNSQAEAAASCPDRALARYDDCTADRLPDGSTLVIVQGYEYPDGRADTKLWTAHLVTPEGRQIEMREWNAAAQKGAPVSRPNPPLSPAQLKAVVTAEKWRAAVDAIPEREPAKGTAPAAPPPAAEGGSVGSTLASLLPKGVEVVSKGGQETEYAYVVVDDGKGRSFVQVNVQGGMSDVEDQLFGPDAKTLPDGTKVATQQGPGEKGATGVVMWTVDTIRPDGLRVVISAFNAADQQSAATRGTPALTMEQLQEIATSAKWRELL